MIDPSYLQTEFLRPLVQAWMLKLRGSEQSNARTQWKEVSDECLTFYNRSCHAMWNPDFTRKVWTGVKAPKFRFTINKAFELVAIYGPNLLWSTPHRQVEPKQRFSMPEQLIQSNPEIMQMVQQLMPSQMAREAEDGIIAHLMQTSLNYFAREQTGGGLAGHSKRGVVDGLLMGRGILVSRPYRFPESERQLVGSFHVDPRNMFLDPDFSSATEARWTAIKHIEPVHEVERRFQVPPGTFKGRGAIESSWANSELATTSDHGHMAREAGQNGDLLVWYEIYSKSGVGSSRSGMMSPLREHLEQVCGEYVYLAISPNVPYPLNCPPDKIRKGATDDEIRRTFRWPVELHKDNRYPFSLLDFYTDPDGPYPIPPLAPGLGELKFLNFMLPWMANRIYMSSRDFWAVASPHVEHYRKQLQEAEDLGIIASPITSDDVRKTIQVMQHAELRQDAWTIVEKVSEMFDKRTGLIEFSYGRNEGGTQDRTAETTQARARAAGVRPEHMQNQVIDWQSEAAGLEAIMARTFVRGKDLEPLLGPLGATAWDRWVYSTDIERSTRQMSFTVAADSVRRPNRERAAANFSALLNSFAGILQSFAEQTGEYGQLNELFRKFGELNDFDMSEFTMQVPEPDPEQQAAAEQQQQMELQKMQMELQKMVLEMQVKQTESQGKQAQVAVQQQSAAQGMQMDQARFMQDTQQDQAKHLLDMVHQHQKHRQQIRHANQAAREKIKIQKMQQKQKPQPKKPTKAA